MANKAKRTKVTNPNEVKFNHVPVYNLATIRKLALALIVKASQDPKKVEAIADTLEVLMAFLKDRAEAGVKAREVAVAAETAKREAAAEAAAKHKIVDAKSNLASAEAGVTKWAAVLDTLLPAKKDAE